MNKDPFGLDIEAELERVSDFLVQLLLSIIGIPKIDITEKLPISPSSYRFRLSNKWDWKVGCARANSTEQKQGIAIAKEKGHYKDRPVKYAAGEKNSEA